MDIWSIFLAVPLFIRVIVGVLLAVYLIYVSRVVVFIGNDSMGIVEKIWSLRGSVRDGFISLDGSAGFQPEVLRGGIHFFMPFQYRIHVKSLPTVPQGTIGYVFARSGQPLYPGQALASLPQDVSFEDVRGFIMGGGQRGPQRQILREGVYAINTAQFVILTSDGNHAVRLSGDEASLEEMRSRLMERRGFEPVVIRDQEDRIGVATVHDGPSLEHEEIIAPSVGTDARDPETYHNCFQDPENFLRAGGRRGRQEQVLVEGTYFINRLFATIDLQPKTVIEIGKVGVVVSYTGPRGNDLTGTEYKHGELVESGKRGVWSRALQPGKYALNPYGVKVIQVPTTNFVLRWIEGRSEEHGFDENLSEIRLITRDAFEPVLPLSIVLHIAYEDAPMVVQQFADLRLLVEQTLDPMVSAYFKDTAQGCTLIELVSKRAEIQAHAVKAMAERFKKYRLNLMEVMIGTPRPAQGDVHIATILDQLRFRQVAEEKVVTYENQRKAADKERELRQAEAIAAAQGDLTRSSVEIKIAENKGSAQLAARQRDADGVRVTAAANAERIRVEGIAEADRIAAVGEAQARSVKAQVNAFGGPEFQLKKELAQILEAAIRDSKNPLVPQVVIGQQADGRGGNAVDALLGMLLSSKTQPAETARSDAR
ncbi:SPFH domain-containing protein [Nevskia soli]|uniref:SPFH domain-containing protein n=1 Tax=Nevskia soli TaxID=418856 RepID=UPI00069115CA|nr:SPFH domain-containing protein [Nevskia soli]